MRISDWSSDVCSSDLHVARHWLGEAFDRHRIAPLQGIEARQIRTARVDQNFATTRLLAQPRRKVHRRTDRGVFTPRRRADHANRDEASGDAKTDADRMRRRNPAPHPRATDRKTVVKGNSAAVSVTPGGRRI